MDDHYSVHLSRYLFLYDYFRIDPTARDGLYHCRLLLRPAVVFERYKLAGNSYSYVLEILLLRLSLYIRHQCLCEDQ